MPEPSSAPLAIFATLMERGGVLMWPLLVLSVVSMTLILERALFWIRLHGPGRTARFEHLVALLRRGEGPSALKRLRRDRSAYARVAEMLIEDGASDAVAVEAVERERPKLDRFMNTLSTVVTAAPLLGILGTVTGIIRSFELLAEQSTLTDPRAVSGGIAEALITTAAGLVVALMALFPYMVFRAQSERAISRLEVIIAAAQEGAARSDSARARGAAAEGSPPERSDAAKAASAAR